MAKKTKKEEPMAAKAVNTKPELSKDRYDSPSRKKYTAEEFIEQMKQIVENDDPDVTRGYSDEDERQTNPNSYESRRISHKDKFQKARNFQETVADALMALKAHSLEGVGETGALAGRHGKLMSDLEKLHKMTTEAADYHKQAGVGFGMADPEMPALVKREHDLPKYTLPKAPKRLGEEAENQSEIEELVEYNLHVLYKKPGIKGRFPSKFHIESFGIKIPPAKKRDAGWMKEQVKEYKPSIKGYHPVHFVGSTSSGPNDKIQKTLTKFQALAQLERQHMSKETLKKISESITEDAIKDILKK